MFVDGHVVWTDHSLVLVVLLRRQGGRHAPHQCFDGPLLQCPVVLPAAL